jgi:hypothetical protein
MLTQSDLAQFSGTTRYYQHWLRRFVYTDGVHHVAETGGAHWLIDAIASYQPKLFKDPMLQEFQHWILKVDLNNQKAQLICERDSDDVVLTQDIGFTDFPLDEIRFYVVSKVLMLPSEY